MLWSDVENLMFGLVQHDAAKLLEIGIDKNTAITMALIRLNKDAPAEIVVDQTIADSRYAALPAEWVDEKSDVVSVEFPIDEEPRQYLDNVEPYTNPTGVVLDLQCTVTGDVRIKYTRPHHLDDTVVALTTVPDSFQEAVASYAGSLVAGQLATHYSKNVSSGFAADRVDQDNKPRFFTSLSKQLLGRYEALVADEEEEDKPAGDVVEIKRPARLLRRY